MCDGRRRNSSLDTIEFAQACVRVAVTCSVKHTSNFRCKPTIIGLNDSECGHIGTTVMPGTPGSTIGAPAAAAYAVLPVGVAMIRPTRIQINTQTNTQAHAPGCQLTTQKVGQLYVFLKHNCSAPCSNHSL